MFFIPQTNPCYNKVMETSHEFAEQLPQEVSLYLDWFDRVAPADVLQAHQDLYRGHIMDDPIRSKLYNHLRHAMALYPSRSHETDPQNAVELYAAFAQSPDTNDTLSMLSILVNLWNTNPSGATEVTKVCLARPVRDKADQTVFSVASEMARQAMLENTWSDNGPSSVLYLTVERIRRNLPPLDNGAS